MWRVAGMLAFALVGCNGPTQTKSVAPSLPIVEEFSPQVAQRATVRVISMGDEFATGSGLIIGKHLVLTNRHVIASAPDANSIYIIDRSGYPRKIQAIIDQNPLMDLAVLYVRTIDGDAASFSLAPPQQLEQVTSLGYPAATDMVFQKFTDTASMTQGQVTAIDRGSLAGRGEVDLITHTATVNPGNSGGPLYNSCGQVVGINTLKADPSQSSNVYVASSTKEIVPYLVSVGVEPKISKAICGRQISSVPENCSTDLTGFRQTLVGNDLPALERALGSLPGTCRSALQEGWSAYSVKAQHAAKSAVALEGTWRLQDGKCDDAVMIKTRGLALAARSGDVVEVEQIVSGLEAMVRTQIQAADISRSKNFSYEPKADNMVLTNTDSKQSWELVRCTG